MCEGVAQEVGPEHDSQQAMQEAKLRVADREQPRREPETTDADLLRHGSAPRLGLLALLSLGVDVRLEDELDVTGQCAPISPGKLHQGLLEAWCEPKADWCSTRLCGRRSFASHLLLT